MDLDDVETRISPPAPSTRIVLALHQGQMSRTLRSRMQEAEMQTMQLIWGCENVHVALLICALTYMFYSSKSVHIKIVNGNIYLCPCLQVFFVSLWMCVCDFYSPGV